MDGGVSAKIRRVTKSRNGNTYDSFVVDYFLLGKRNLVWRSDLEDAKQVARDACGRIAAGEQQVLTLTNTDRMTYIRAKEYADKVGAPLDTIAQRYANFDAIVEGKVCPDEVARDWVKRSSDSRPRIMVADALNELIAQARTDGKSTERLRRLETNLGKFAEDINVEVHTITPDIVSRWLSALTFTERTKKNYRDFVGFFSRFCVRRGYLAKGTDWLDGVQEYSARRFGQVEIYTPEEITLLLFTAERRYQSMVPFLAIGAFAGLRHAEITRLDWKDIELSKQPGESFIHVGAVENTKTDQRRRLVPVQHNLKAWLLKYHKESGPVCPTINTTKQSVMRIAAAASMEWKHNALRHSCISYRVAESGDVARVADESGNSAFVIRTNYLRRVKPTQAMEWFSIMPKRKAKR